MTRIRTELARLGVGALVGLISAGVALGVGELVAALVRPSAAPVIAVGNRFILLTPEWLKEYAIRRFGSNDKNALLAGIYVAIAVFAAVLGRVAIARLWAGLVTLAGFGAVGVWSAATANAARPTDVVPTIVGTLLAMAALAFLVRATARGDQRPLPARWRTEPAPPDSSSPAASRRTFLLGSAGVAVVAAGAGVLGRVVQDARFNAARSRAAVRLPRPASPAGPLPAGVTLDPAASSFVTENSAFYRVDTALTVPQLTTDAYTLRIRGRVDRELSLSYQDLLDRPLIERYVTMTCVSNPVGGPYVGTARFLGVPLAPLLREAGVDPAADQIVGTSVDGMTIGTPTAVIMDGRDAMLAVGMNGEPLPIEHGFPVRMLVPGLYGYVSATKWLTQLTATTFADDRTYWVQRGWTPQAPINLESRIDTPKGLAMLRAGQQVVIAGVAWQQHVGIKAVQVRIAGGPWQTARLGRVPSTDTWVQWALPWTVTGHGPVTLEVRAIDRDGVEQSPTQRDPFPSGATGYHSVVVQVA